MPAIPPLLLSAFWVFAACQQDPLLNRGANRLPTDSVSIGGASFFRQSLEIGEHSDGIAVADVNGDGHLDVAVASVKSVVTIFHGDGQGGLRRGAQLPAGENPTDLAMADIDGNGTLDMLVANHDTDYLSLLLGDGSGAFRPAPNSPFPVAVDPHPHTVIACDVDRDGHLDLLVDHRSGEGVLILRGTGGGRFESPGTLIPVGGDPYRGMAVGDLDRDGQLDLVTPNPASVGIFLGAGDLTFHAAQSLPAAEPFAVQLADFNGDGMSDVVSASGEGSSLVNVFLGDGTGELREAPGSPFESGPGATKIARGDFNGDGIDDVAVTSYHSADVLVLLGGLHTIRSVQVPAGEHPWGLTAGDLNEDGFDELIILDDASPVATIYLSIAR